MNTANVNWTGYLGFETAWFRFRMFELGKAVIRHDYI